LKFKELAGKGENYLALHALPRLAGLWETIPVFFATQNPICKLYNCSIKLLPKQERYASVPPASDTESTAPILAVLTCSQVAW
jgi:hypothetical protein